MKKFYVIGIVLIIACILIGVCIYQGANQDAPFKDEKTSVIDKEKLFDEEMLSEANDVDEEDVFDEEVPVEMDTYLPQKVQSEGTMRDSGSSSAAKKEKETATEELFTVGDYIQLGKYYDAPILWRCVDKDENGMLMLSDKILCRKPFDVYVKSRHPSDVSGSHIRRGVLESNYWADSNIRSWLNSDKPAGEVTWLCGNPPTHKSETDNYFNAFADEKGFLADGNFTQSERSVIKEVTQKSLLDRLDAELAVGGSEDAWGTMKYDTEIDTASFIENQYDEICFEYVTDKVFLLDIKQLRNISKNEMLSESYTTPLVMLTEEAIKNDEEDKYWVSQGKEPDLNPQSRIPYWLRTPFGGELDTGTWFDGGMDGSSVMCSLTGTGTAFNHFSLEFADLNLGVRPAFYLDEANAIIKSGSGTAEDPYVVDGKE